MLTSSPEPHQRRPVLIALFLIASLAVGALLVTWIADQARERSQTESMRTRLSELRRDAEGCRLALARQEDAFRRFGVRVDSLRNAVREYEDDGSVPEEVYEQYLAVFDRYNEAVPDWEYRANSLREIEMDCRTTIEAHNQLADSVRTALEAAPD